MTARSGSESDPQTVELKVPALGAYVSVLRTTAAALAARLDFTLDEIDDLRLGVDEASALLLAQAAEDSTLTCDFTLAGDELTTAVSVVSPDPRVPPEDSFAWTVLTALAGPVKATIDPARGRVTLTLTKRAEGIRQPGVINEQARLRRLDDARRAGRSRKPAKSTDSPEPRTAEQ